MTWDEWSAELDRKTTVIKLTRKILDKACDDRDSFLKETLGFIPGDVASIEGTAMMISAIVDMKNNEGK